MDPAELTERLKRTAVELGFELAGVCPAVEPGGASRLAEWLAAGYAGEMRFIADRQAAYAHPRHVLDGARSLLVLALNYRTREPEPLGPGQGRVARYAWHRDYHDLIHERLHVLADELRRLVPGAQARGVVDTAPLLEREFAVLAGLGWIGKNTLVLHPRLGSWFFLAVLLTDQSLVYDQPFAGDHCGTCRACLDACPTGAFVAPYLLDSRRCLSYLTIEHRSSVPAELRGELGEWAFGCDVCQEVCPWNHRAPLSTEPELQAAAGQDRLDLGALFDLDEGAFRARFRGTPLWRPKRRGLLRTAALLLGNQRQPASLPALVRGLADEEPLVREASAWALGQLGSEPAAREALAARLAVEVEPLVSGAIEQALAGP